MRQSVPDDNLPFVSVIIVNYNGKHLLEECLTSVKSSSYPSSRFEVILVDNASTDGSVRYVSENFAWVKILQLDKNYGFCKPNNEGAKIARGEYIVLLSNDTVVTREWLSELIKGISIDAKVVCCASKILYYDRRDVVNAAGGEITIIGSGIYRGYGDKDGSKYSEQSYTGFGCGAGLLVRKGFFESIGGFDEDYFASCEENDLGWKSWLFGHKVLYVPTAIMYHKESATFGTRSWSHPAKVYLVTRNRLFNIVKNLETTNVLRALLISLAFNLYRAVRYLMDANFASMKSSGKAHIDFVRNLGPMLSKRKTVQRDRRLSDKELYKLGVIATFKESILEERRLNKVLSDEFYKTSYAAPH